MNRPYITVPVIYPCPNKCSRGWTKSARGNKCICSTCDGRGEIVGRETDYREMTNEEWMSNLETRLSKIEEFFNDATTKP